MEWLVLRKRADKSGPEPDLAGGESWPLAGVELVGEAPKNAQLSTGYVAQGQMEGWIELEGFRVVEDRAGIQVHAEAIVLKLVNGTLRYRVLENPGLIADPEGHPGRACQYEGCEGHRVEHQYTLKLAKGAN